MQGHIHKRVRTCKNGRTSVLWYVVVDLPPGADGKRRQKWLGENGVGGFHTAGRRSPVELIVPVRSGRIRPPGGLPPLWP